MRSYLLVLLVACSSAASPPGGTAIANRAPADTTADADRPLSRDEIALARVPASTTEIRALLVGTWRGRAYDYQAEGDPPFSGDPGDYSLHSLVIRADGSYTEGDDCQTVGRFAIEQHPGIPVELRRFRESNCRGDPPYNWPSTIHRLDGDVLVLIDGMTAAVSGYRRVR